MRRGARLARNLRLERSKHLFGCVLAADQKHVALAALDAADLGLGGVELLLQAGDLGVLPCRRRQRRGLIAFRAIAAVLVRKAALDNRRMVELLPDIFAKGGPPFFDLVEILGEPDGVRFDGAIDLFEMRTRLPSSARIAV